MKQRVKYPYGVSNFEKLINEDYVFIDKTAHIERLEEDENYVSFLRPRKIGKSLFVSVLEYYYDVLCQDKFEALFGNTYIGKNPTPLANSFRILKFDFSGIDTNTRQETEEGFLSKIQTTLSAFFVKYELLDEATRQHILAKNKPSAMIGAFLESYKNAKPYLPIYLLIDEYDHFTNEILWRNLSEFKISVSQDGYVRKFYENIKIATQAGTVSRFFITGVSPITLDSLTSGFNIVTHLTHNPTFHDMVGFTEAEVGKLLDLALAEPAQKDAIINDLKAWYNGYKFSRKAKNTVYNANMTLFFLKEFSQEQEYPTLMLDPNIMPDYGKLKKMFEIANFEGNIAILEEILAEDEIESEEIYQFDFEKPSGFGKAEFVNFLYYLGNLTIKEENQWGNGIIFKVPNQVIKELYWKYYASVLQERLHFPYQEDSVKTSLYAASAGDVAPFLGLIEKSLQALSNRDFQRFDEKYIKMLIVAYASLGSAFYVITERETEAGGYIDVEMYIRPNNTHTHHQYVMEVKYIKKDSEKNFEAIKEEATTQLRHYLQTDSLLQSKKMLHPLVVIFVKDALFWEELK